MYLELGKGEPTSSPDTAVVLEGRTPHDRSQLVDWARSQGGGLRTAGIASPNLRTWLP